MGWGWGLPRLAMESLRGLGRRHLAGLCLGDGGGGLVITQRVLATVQRVVSMQFGTGRKR